MSEIAEFTRHLGHYLPPLDVALVERAFAFSESAHQGQFRKSGEPYITHPLAVASILSQWRLDAQGLANATVRSCQSSKRTAVPAVMFAKAVTARCVAHRATPSARGSPRTTRRTSGARALSEAEPRHVAAGPFLSA